MLKFSTVTDQLACCFNFNLYTVILTFAYVRVPFFVFFSFFFFFFFISRYDASLLLLELSILTYNRLRFPVSSLSFAPVFMLFLFYLPSMIRARFNLRNSEHHLSVLPVYVVFERD